MKQGKRSTVARFGFQDSWDGMRNRPCFDAALSLLSTLYTYPSRAAPLHTHTHTPTSPHCTAHYHATLPFLVLKTTSLPPPPRLPPPFIHHQPTITNMRVEKEEIAWTVVPWE